MNVHHSVHLGVCDHMTDGLALEMLVNKDIKINDELLGILPLHHTEESSTAVSTQAGLSPPLSSYATQYMGVISHNHLLNSIFFFFF